MLEANLLNRKRSSGGNTNPYRYFRMWITARNLSAAITVGEWELLDAAGINRALGKPATASAAEFGNASGAFDGIIPATLAQPRWQTNAPAHPQWIRVDLGSIIQIVRFNLYCDSSQISNFADYSPRNWIFQGSLNDTVWEDILPVNNWTTAVWKTKRKHEWNANGTPV